MFLRKVLSATLVGVTLISCGGGSSSPDLPSAPTSKTISIGQLNLSNASALASLLNGNVVEFLTAVADKWLPPAAADATDTTRTSVTLSTGDTCNALCAVIYKASIPYVGNNDLVQPEAELPITSLSNIEINFNPADEADYLIVIVDKSKIALSEQVVGTLSLKSSQKNLDAIPLGDVKSVLDVGDVSPSGNLELTSTNDLTTISTAMTTFTEADLVSKGNFDDTAKYFVNIYLNSYAGDTAGKYVYSAAMAVANINCKFTANDFSDPAACSSVDNNVEFHLAKSTAALKLLEGKTLSLYPPYDIDLVERRGYAGRTPTTYGQNNPFTFTATMSDDGRAMIPVPLMTTDTNVDAGIWTVKDGAVEIAAADFSFSMPFDRNGMAASLIPVVKIERDASNIAQTIIVKYMYYDGTQYTDTEHWNDYIEAYRGAFIQLHFTNQNAPNEYHIIQHFEDGNSSSVRISTSTDISTNVFEEDSFSYSTNGNQLIYDVSHLNANIGSLSFRIPFATQYMFEFSW